MKTFLIVVVLSGLMLIVSGCATTESTMMVNSNPDGAKVTIIDQKGDGVHSGTTPMTIRLKTSAAHYSPARYQILFEKDGYFPSSQDITAERDHLKGGWRLPQNIHQKLFPAPLESAEQKYYPSPTLPQPEKTSNDAFTKLKKLKELNDEGILTDEEYELKRKALLEEINTVTQSATF